jgi:hypothetical protein
MKPLFQMPFMCHQKWRASTYDGHAPDQDSIAPTGFAELVGDDFLHTFTRFAHQKIVAVSIRHAKLAVTSMEKNKITGGC